MDPSGRDAGLVFLFLQQLSIGLSLSAFPTLPRRVHHYTTAAGFAGILHDGGMRATNFSFLNDPSEIQYARDLALVTLSDMRDSATGQLRELLEHTRTALALKASWEPYLACFSSLADDISQWRAYASSAAERYCLGFDAKTLASSLSVQPTARFVRLLYRKEEQVQRIVSFGEQAVEFVSNNNIDPTNWDAVGKVVADIMAWVLPEIKDPAYECEAEWRIIFRGDESAESPEFDTSQGTLRPFRRFQLPKPIPLREVCVLAPKRKPLALKAANMLLQSAALEIQATHSSVPFAD
jgi:hypothetical protein